MVALKMIAEQVWMVEYSQLEKMSDISAIAQWVNEIFTGEDGLGECPEIRCIPFM